ncbi:hypothetical protein [Actinokineospora sp. NBRC 105648]|uniref:hypothetical protein n=1 Tax=Actinokineospora sp. NBRC 105648 TaxID=3032206 RepID=UPI0024A1A6B6|nr:hypothetical protein [Actinokineospora sp. NBRC 105648]GLZ41153.1 hypothetical protein Acsp05_47770 [Actinokineospora sp. NBRC 105648]
MTEPDPTEAALNRLRRRIERLEADRLRTRSSLGNTLWLVALSAVLLTLTCATWFTRGSASPYTLWELVDPVGGPALFALGSVLAVGFGTIGLATSESKWANRAMALVSAAVVVAVGVLDSGAGKNEEVAPAGWAALVVAGAIGCLHIARTLDKRAWA